MIIRSATLDDAESLSFLILENAETILLPYYSAAQWTVFTQYYSPEIMRKKIGTQQVFCADKQGEIVGTIALDKDFLVGFYTKLSHLKQGIGRQLLAFIEKKALENGYENLQLAASPEGVGFYEKNGWIKLKDMNFNYLGVDFLETLMLKNLFIN